jgi:hypothetical protein
MGAFRETFNYLGMHFGGAVHVNCRDGYLPAVHDSQAAAFAALVKEGRIKGCGDRATRTASSATV